MPADLLWDALADALSTMTLAAVICVGTCLFGCTEVCARAVQAGTGKAGRLY